MSDPLGITAQPLDRIHRTTTSEDLHAIGKYIDEFQVEAIVIGLPLNMNGSEGFMVDAVRAFTSDIISKFGLKVYEIDERLTSHQAQRCTLASSPKSKKKMKSNPKRNIDTVAAQIILQTYLDSTTN